jgi:hypothetical protein
MLHLSDSEKMSSACAAGEAANAKIEKIIDYLPPEPLAGKDSFNIYPAKNIRNPEPGKQKGTSKQHKYGSLRRNTASQQKLSQKKVFSSNKPINPCSVQLSYPYKNLRELRYQLRIGEKYIQPSILRS